ncbi:MAG: septum formation protein Maf [Acidobacteria bacterium]|nr:septum formation protein Maf [Acidobacteriota bacterium]
MDRQTARVRRSPRLVLASASPRRAELLRAAGIDFDVLPADVDESVQPGETPEQHVRRLADVKAQTAAARAVGRPILAADTVVVLDGAILGKPENDEDARRMLRRLSGRAHQVMTGVCLVSGASPSGPPGAPAVVRPPTDVAVTTVELAALTDAEIDWYVASGETADKAGAYAIQGLASRFIVGIDGSYSNVVGLPVDLVYRMCREAGLLVS